MKTRITISAIFAMALVFASNSNAATITTGGLTYNDATHIITGTDGTYYLGWDQAASLNYAETLDATKAGGQYEQYHIASQTEAYAFYNLAIQPTPPVRVQNSAHARHQSAIGYLGDARRFGDSTYAYIDYAWFISDEPGMAGFLSTYNDPAASWMILHNDFHAIAKTDWNSAGGILSFDPVSWLLVGDEQLIATPIPAALFMFAPALLGFFGLRRKLKA